MNRSGIETTFSNVSDLEGQWHVMSSIEHPHWASMPPLSQDVQTAIGCIATLNCALAVTGTLAVVVQIMRFRSLRTYSNLFVLNLAVSDLLMALGNIPMLIISSFSGHWVFGVAGCYVYAFLGAVGSFVSINTLAVISIDRCFVILKTIPGQKRMSRRTFASIISAIWLYAIIWASGPFFGFGRYILEGTNTSCTFDFFSKTPAVQGFVIAIFIMHFCIPVTAVAISHFLLSTAISLLRQQFLEASRVYGEDTLPRRRNGSINETKTTRAVIIVILVFCISWAPYACVALFGVFGDASKITRLAAGLPGLFAKCSAAFNPIVYAFLHPRFRSKLCPIDPCRRVKNKPRPEIIKRPFWNWRSRIMTNV